MKISTIEVKDGLPIVGSEPVYHQMVFSLTEQLKANSPGVTLDVFAYFFRDRALPEKGDRIEWVCTKRDEDQIVIDLVVVKP